MIISQIYVYRMWGIKAEVQVSKKKFHTNTLKLGYIRILLMANLEELHKKN